MKGFRTNQSIIGEGNSQTQSKIFRSEVVGVSESKLLMKKTVGKYSRLERFRRRKQADKSFNQGQIIRKNRRRGEELKEASSVFDSIARRKRV